MEELKPCPFCGSNAISLFNPNCTPESKYCPTDHAYPLVRCQGCFTEVPGKDWDYSGDTAIKAWNTRTQPQNTEES
jgi:Lar family restriction alleviation protein